MGTKYPTQSISGYNATPPPDDGSQVAANVVEWDKHKTKLGDPLKNLAEGMNTALVEHFDVGPDSKIGNYNAGPGDYNTVLEFNGSSLTATLPTAASVGAGYFVSIKNVNSTSLTVDVSGGGTIDGSASISLGENGFTTFMVNNGATEYMTVGGQAGFGSGLAANDELVFGGGGTIPAGFSALAFDDGAIKIVQSTPGPDGGTDNFSASFTAAKATDGHALTEAQLASHDHSLTAGVRAFPGFYSTNNTGNGTAGNWTGSTGVGSTDNAGSGSPHSHTIAIDVKYHEMQIIVKS